MKKIFTHVLLLIAAAWSGFSQTQTIAYNQTVGIESWNYHLGLQSTINYLSVCQTAVEADFTSQNYGNGQWTDAPYDVYVNGGLIASHEGNHTIDLSLYMPVSSVQIVKTGPSGNWNQVSVTVRVTTTGTTPPPAPAATSVTYCAGDASAALQGLLSGDGVSLRWYLDENGSGYSTVAPSASGSATYWVAQVNVSGCESKRSQVNVNVSATPQPSVEPSYFLPEGALASSLPQLAQNQKWYASANAATPLTPSALLQTGTFYVSQTIDGCESARTAVLIYVGTPVTQVTAAQCGTTLGTLGQLVTADNVPGATAYRFRITNLANGSVRTIVSASNNFTLMNLPAISYNTAYKVAVEVQHQGQWTGVYGPACDVFTPAADTTPGPSSITSPVCGNALQHISALISTPSLNAAKGYRYRVTNLTNPEVAVQVLTRAQNFFSLPMLSSFAYGTAYQIEIATLVNGSYTEYGAPCYIYSPAVPKLVNGFAEISSTTTPVATYSLPQVNAYRFEIVNMSTNSTFELERPNYHFTMSLVPGFTMGDFCMARVSVRTGSTWSPYGDFSDIFSFQMQRNTAETSIATAASLKVTAYPSPFTQDFSIAFEAAEKSAADVVIVDMTGRVLVRTTVSADEMGTAKFGQELPTGVYNLVVSQGSEVRTLRVIKR